MAPSTGDAAATRLGRPLRVLWAEDSDADRFLIRAAMEESGSPASVTFVGDGAAALADLARGPSDLVVLDLDMPGLGGIETLRRIRGGKASATLPITLFSSRPSSELQQADLGACSAYVQKPVAFTAFVAAVALVLRTTLEPHVARLQADVQPLTSRSASLAPPVRPLPAH